MINASSFSFPKESPRDEQCAVRVARVACMETKTTTKMNVDFLNIPDFNINFAFQCKTEHINKAKPSADGLKKKRIRTLNINLTTNWQNTLNTNLNLTNHNSTCQIANYVFQVTAFWDFVFWWRHCSLTNCSNPMRTHTKHTAQFVER